VYKKTETDKLVKDLSMKTKLKEGGGNIVERWEISCIANSFILNGLPTEKYFTLLKETCSGESPVFPTSRFGDLCKALRVNATLSLYSHDHRTRGRNQRHYFYGEEGDEKVYHVGRVEDHYVPDVPSGWALSAIRNYMYFKEISGRLHCSLPFHKIKLLKSIRRRSNNQSGLSFRYADKENDEFATYGELLSVIVWGHVQHHHNEEVFEQFTLVEPMTVENICLRAELFLHFQKMLKVIDLPTSCMNGKELEEYVGEHTRPIEKRKRLVLNRVFESANPSLWGNKYRISGRTYSYDLSNSYYSKYGVELAREWEFYDHHSLSTAIKIRKAGNDVPPETVYFSVPLPFTIVAFDTETVCIPESIVAVFRRYYNELYNHKFNVDHNEDTNNGRFNPFTVDSTLSKEGVADFEYEIGDEDDEGEGEGEGEDDEENSSDSSKVHYPYCVSVCYVVDTRNNHPYNFRNMDQCLFEKGEETSCFGEEVFQRVPYLSLVKKTFIGLDCMIQLCAFLGSSLFNDVSIHLIAHNARYDINMMVKYSFALISEGIFRSASRMNCCELKIQSFPDISYSQLTRDEANRKVMRMGGEENNGGRIFRRSNVWKHTRSIHVQCTLATTGIPLSSFASTFRMNVKKEFMPYSLYTYEKLFGEMHLTPPVHPDTVDSILSIEEAWRSTSASDDNEFMESVAAANALVSTTNGLVMSMWDYAVYYCEMDCEVLLKGFLSLRKEMFQLQIPLPGQEKIDSNISPFSMLRLENAVSLPQFANHYFGLCGVFEGVHEYKGALMNFMRRGVTGGKTMLAANSPVVYDAFKMGDLGMDDAIDDLDAVNLYPSAMKEIATKYGGFPCGKPKIWVPEKRWQKGEPWSSFLPTHIARDAHYYFILVRIKKLGRPLRFPIVNGPRDCFPMFINPDKTMFAKTCDGVNIEEMLEETEKEDYFSSAEEMYKKLTSSCSSRHFTNHPEGARLVVDKFTFEDIIEFHRGAEVEILQALYWDQGGTTAIGKVVEYLYASRLKLADEGRKAAAQARKLTMNSGYGRFLMGAPDSTHYFVEGRDNIQRYIARHSCTTKNAVLIRNDFAVVERRKGVQDFFNSSHLGAMVLSVSKRIMNRVMVLYEDMHDVGLFSDFRMFYMDTDSIHICKSHIVKLFKEYTERYKERILVTPGVETDYSLPTKALGMFNTDFEPIPNSTPPLSTVFIGVMKKVYLDCMLSWKKDLPSNTSLSLKNADTSYHVRMKGVPTKCVKQSANDTNMSLQELYIRLLRGESVTFDLAKYSTRFEMGKNFSVSTNTSFTRNVKLNPYSLVIAHLEWVKSGWDKNTFPYYVSLTKASGTLTYPLYDRRFNWEFMRMVGKENFYYSCTNASDVYLVTLANLHSGDRYLFPYSSSDSSSSSSSSSSDFTIPVINDGYDFPQFDSRRIDLEQPVNMDNNHFLTDDHSGSADGIDEEIENANFPVDMLDLFDAIDAHVGTDTLTSFYSPNFFSSPPGGGTNTPSDGSSFSSFRFDD
jgi:hypothetical protein